MAAIVTEQFRRNTAKSLLADITNTNYYVGLGKSDSWVEDEQLTNWSVPIADGTNGEAEEIKSNLITLIKAETANCRLVIPRVNYKSGSRYKTYTPYDENCFYPETINGITYLPCYVVTTIGSNIAIYLCLHGSSSESISPPNDTTSYVPRSYGNDGYIWALVDIFTSVDAPINTDQYISINTGTVSSNQATTIANTSGGILYGFTVLSGGSGYSGSQSVRFDAYTAISQTPIEILCTATVVNGQITALSLPSQYAYTTTGIINGTFEFLNNLNGTGAIIVPNITPSLGLANTPSDILPSWFVGISAKAIDDISADGFYIPYRQVSILRNLQHNQIGNPATLGALKYLIITQPVSALASVEPGTPITFNNDTVALFDSYATVTVSGSPQYRVYYHQNTVSGYGKIISSGTITIENNTALPYSSILNNEYVPGTGEVIFIENRKPIVRAQSQTEEIKIIIQL
jgi:hypothetical protein